MANPFIAEETWRLDLDHVGKLVLLWYARRANAYGTAWPSLGDIATHCQIAESTASETIRELEHQGHLQTSGWAVFREGRWHLYLGAYKPGRGHSRVMRVLPWLLLDAGQQPDPRASAGHQEPLRLNGRAPERIKVPAAGGFSEKGTGAGGASGSERFGGTPVKVPAAGPNAFTSKPPSTIRSSTRARARDPHVDPAAPAPAPGPAILDGAVSSSNGADLAAQSLAALYKIIIADPTSNARQRVEASAKLEELAPRLNPHPATGAGPRTPADPVLANSHRNGG